MVAAVASAPTWYCCVPPPERVDWTVGATLVGSLLFSGLLLSPDLDLNSSIYKRWGPLRFIWWPYQKCVRHRSIISHSFFVGPFLRVIYFILVSWGLFRAVTWVMDVTGVAHFDRNALSRNAADSFVAFWRAHPHHLAMAALGLFLGAALHLIADLVWTGIKKRY